MENITIAGVLTLVIIISSGATYYVQSIGDRTSCKNGWAYVDSGQFEGYYKCMTTTGTRNEVCFSVYDSLNTKNYWCEKGKIIIQKEPESQGTVNQSSHSSKKWICRVNGCEDLRGEQA